jgi:hypothetical protein
MGCRQNADEQRCEKPDKIVKVILPRYLACPGEAEKFLVSENIVRTLCTGAEQRA